MPLQILGLNHNTAPVEIREQLVFSGDEIGRALVDLAEIQGVDEAVLLSTCNRTECYVITNDGGCDRLKDWLHAEEQEAIIMKGFAKPIRTFKVMGIYDELAAEGRVIHRDINGLSVTIDRQRLSQSGKGDAIKELKSVLAELEDGS